MRRAMTVAALWWLWALPAGAQDAGSDLGLGALAGFGRPTRAPAMAAPLDEPEPVVGMRLDAEMEERVVRPFYTRRATPDGEYSRTQVLWPLWLYERKGERRRVQLLPIYYYQRDVHRYGDVEDDESDWAVFPLLWGGRSTRDGNYFALFPIGGNLKGLLAKDEIRFVLFPLWFQWRDKGHVSTTWLWPIFTRGTGGGKETLRVWPLYGHTVKAGVYDRRFALWPFFYREDFDLNRPVPGRRGMTWPVWTYEYSANRDYRSVLWPFFSVEENHRGDYREVAAPWPFFVRRQGASDKLQVWPVFTGFREAGRETHHVAGPLIRYSKDTSEPGVVRSQTSVAMVLRDERITWTETGAEYHYARVWPFFDHEEWPEGASQTNLLSLIWFRDSRGFEYQYAPVYTLYHHERHPDGRRLSWALWNLYRHERTPERNTWRVWPVMRYTANTEAGTAQFDVLGGLVGLRHKSEARWLRLVWGTHIPLRARPSRGEWEPVEHAVAAVAPASDAFSSEAPAELPAMIGT